MTMKTTPWKSIAGLAVAGWLGGTTALASDDLLTVAVDRPGPALNPAMWGIFFEDINYGGDGGLYPERVKNRSFEFTQPLMGWTEYAVGGAKGTLTVLDRDPLHPHNPHYLRITAEQPGDSYGAVNEGFFGIGVQAGAEFTFSVHARVPQGAAPALRVRVVDADGRRLGQATLRGFTPQWGHYRRRLRVNATEPKARLQVCLAGAGTLDLDMISLFPRDTWRRRPNGLRPDLVQLLADLQPGFMRFPGGCIVEGRDLSKRYQWKTTIGSLAERKLIINRWNDEFAHRPAPDYFQSFGLGFFEFFQLCEDIGAEPLPILNCGMACQFNTGELAPLNQLEPYIQDALDLIEFAKGPATSPWGARRAALGHAPPFPLRLLGVGNEQWGPQYLERYTRFAQALKARYPEVQLVASAGPRPDDELFDFLWPKLRELRADIVDEHCYAPPDWFFQNAHRYDRYDRAGPKVFMGEFAAQSVKVVSPHNRNNWECALAEAAYMTGLERNGDVVVLSSYAPLFGHVEGWQWTPNLIWFDNLRSYGTPNYYVQQLFSRHRGTRLLPLQLTGDPTGTNLYASAVLDETKGEIVVKLVNPVAAPRRVQIRPAGAPAWAAKGRAVTLASNDLQAENSLEQPRRVAPVATNLAVPDPFAYEAPPRTLTVLRLRARGLR
jgi:alpha-N-arabinofuranosidase